MFVGTARIFLFQAIQSRYGFVWWRALPQNASGVVVVVLVQFDPMLINFMHAADDHFNTIVGCGGPVYKDVADINDRT